MSSRSGVPRVVIDTNVFVAAAFNAGSHAARVLEAIRDRRLRLIWSEATRRETRLILERIPPISWSDVAALFQEEHRFSGEADPRWFANVRDPEDRKFAALAYAADATLITQDDDLLEIRQGVGIRIITPVEFIAGFPSLFTKKPRGSPS